jgi:hypothetical protein
MSKWCPRLTCLVMANDNIKFCNEVCKMYFMCVPVWNHVFNCSLRLTKITFTLTSNSPYVNGLWVPCQSSCRWYCSLNFICGARPPTITIPDSTLSPNTLTSLSVISSYRTLNSWHSQKSQMSGRVCRLANERHWSFRFLAEKKGVWCWVRIEFMNMTYRFYTAKDQA